MVAAAGQLQFHFTAAQQGGTVTDAPKNDEEKILWVLQAAWPNWTPAPDLARIALGYGRAIHSLRHKKGWLITNRIEIVNGKRHGFFRLGSRPVPSSKELRARREPPAAEAATLFGDLLPDRTYQE